MKELYLCAEENNMYNISLLILSFSFSYGKKINTQSKGKIIQVKQQQTSPNRAGVAEPHLLIWDNIRTDRWTDRQTDGQTDRQGCL